MNDMNFIDNRNWLISVKGSIPAHSTNIADCLEYAMNTYKHGLSDIDAHGCALAAAIASGNGGLGDEIATNGPLFRKPERETAKTAAATAAADDVLSLAIPATRKARSWTGTFTQEYGTFKSALYAPLSNLEGTKINYIMYYLAAMVVYKNEVAISKQVEFAISMGVTNTQITGIIMIASSMAAINRIIL